MSRNPHIKALEIQVLVTDHNLADEVRDAMWADYGRMVHARITSPDLVQTVSRAGVKCTTVIEMVGHIRAFILTGAKP